MKRSHTGPSKARTIVPFVLLAALGGVVTYAVTRPADDGMVRVGVQAGHWRTEDLPDELASFRTSTGASAGGVDEVDINLSIARRVAALLEERGVTVDVLPSTIPPGYRAEAFISLHADGSESPRPRGYKLATPYDTVPESELLLDALAEEYAAATGLPRDPTVTRNMRGYYAFDGRSYEHSIDSATPAVILEMGFVSNPRDRALLTEDADRVARAIADGILRYLRAAGELEGTPEGER